MKRLSVLHTKPGSALLSASFIGEDSSSWSLDTICFVSSIVHSLRHGYDSSLSSFLLLVGHGMARAMSQALPVGFSKRVIFLVLVVCLFSVGMNLRMRWVGSGGVSCFAYSSGT